MRIRNIIQSPEQRLAYADFMLKYEVYSLRIACVIGAIHTGLFLVLDYWRAEHYSNVILFRSPIIILLVFFTYYSTTIRSRALYNVICIIISISIFVLHSAMDLMGGMPAFYLPNFVCLLFYVFNAGLGYQLRLKITLSIIYVWAFITYAWFFSPHQQFHLAQSFNIIVNGSISLIIGFLIERYKQLNFIQREESISARKKIEELDSVKTDLISTLAQRNEELRAIFDSTEASIIVTDINGIITHFNKGAEHLLGYYSSEVIGKVTPAIIHLADEVKQRGKELTSEFGREISGFNVLVEFARQGRSESREWTYVKKDGTKFSVQLVVTVLQDENKNIYGFLGIATDISEVKTQSAIIKSQKENLEVLNSTKDKFFSIVAHDLKSPLNSLKSFSSLLIDHYDKLSKAEIVSMSHHLKSSIDNTIKMADNLITWARVQMNDLQYSPETIKVNDIATNICEVYRDVASNKGLTISCLVGDSLTIVGDKNQIEFVIRNLVNNAIKFTHKGGSVRLTAKALPNGYIDISVSDSGVGIPDEMKDSLFSIGKKQSANGTAGEKGTGLGLMLCYEFIKLNGGQIEVESTLGNGTIFHTTFKSGG